MSGRKGKSKVKVSGARPDLPPFLQRIREQLVADEDADRREQSEKKRKSRPARIEDPDDAPELVRVGDDNITEEEFERMKNELETKYRLDNKKPRMTDDLDMDYLIKSLANKRALRAPNNMESHGGSNQPHAKSVTAESSKDKTNSNKPTARTKSTKTLDYGSSSSDEL